MNRMKSISSLITVISLFLSVIWLGQAMAASAPVFKSLGQLKANGMAIPRAIDLDGAGNLYVADVESGAVYKFDKFNNFVRSYDVQANGLGVAVAADGSTLFVSQMGGKVIMIDPQSGDSVGMLSGFGSACEIDLDTNDQYVFVADTSNSLVKVFDVASRSLVTQFGGAGSEAGSFGHIAALTVAPSGQVVVADGSSTNYKVHVFNLDSGFNATAVAYSNLDAGVFGSELAVPRGVAFDGQGRAYFLEFATSEIRVVDVSGPLYDGLSVYSKPGRHLGNLNAVRDAVYAVDSKRLYVSCGDGRVEIFGIDGGSTPQAVNHPPTTPSPISPIAGVVSSATPTFEFANSADEDGDALSYHVVVSQNETVVSQVTVDGAEGSTTTATITGRLAENASFSWTVQADDGDKLSAISASSTFTVDAIEEAPAAPKLVSQFNGLPVDGEAVLEWTEVVDPDPADNVKDYLLEVSADVDFGSNVMKEYVDGNFLQLSDFVDYASLVDGDSYYWRVTARVDSEESSAPSAVDSFVYDTTMLSVSANVPGAKVSLHGNHAFAGQFLGVAPFGVRDFTPGTMSVVVERAGFEPFVAQVTLAAGDNVDLYAELVPAMVIDKLSVSRNGINGRSGLDAGSDAAPFLVDFDNDGDLDLLVGDSSSETLTLYKNMQIAGRNRLTFDQGEVLAVTGSVPFVVDWNNDGKKDLIVGQVGGEVTLYNNTGSEVAPEFDFGTELVSVASFAAPAVIDFNGDGLKDLLVGNASGQLTLFLNGDAGLADGVFLETPAANSSAVPMPVDWDADGQQDLLVSAGGVVTVYKLIDSEYQAAVQFEDRRSAYVAAFPIDLNGSGKQMLVGQADGQIVYLTGNSTEPVASFHLALQAKVDELAELAGESFAVEVGTVEALVDAGDYAAAADATSALIAVLTDDAALQSAIELLALL